MALDEIAAWEVALAAALTVAAVVAMVRLGGRLYAGSILNTGRTGWRRAWADAEL
jgi:ABC-2 type transport system permease protein